MSKALLSKVFLCTLISLSLVQIVEVQTLKSSEFDYAIQNRKEAEVGLSDPTSYGFIDGKRIKSQVNYVDEKETRAEVKPKEQATVSEKPANIKKESFATFLAVLNKERDKEINSKKKSKAVNPSYLEKLIKSRAKDFFPINSKQAMEEYVLSKSLEGKMGLSFYKELQKSKSRGKFNIDPIRVLQISALYNSYLANADKVWKSLMKRQFVLDMQAAQKYLNANDFFMLPMNQKKKSALKKDELLTKGSTRLQKLELKDSPTDTSLPLTNKTELGAMRHRLKGIALALEPNTNNFTIVPIFDI